MSVKGGIQSVDLVAVPVLMGYKKTKKKKIVFFVAFCNFVIVAHSVNLPHLSYFSGQGAGGRGKEEDNNERRTVSTNCNSYTSLGAHKSHAPPIAVADATCPVL